MRLTWGSISGVLRRPDLWPTAVATMAALAPPRWWARPPFLPIPDAELVDWRMTTAYGTADTALDETDLLAYLEWRREAVRGSGGTG